MESIGLFLYLISVVCVLLASIRHSFRNRTAEFSFNFFFFAYILVFPRLGVHSFRNEVFTGYSSAIALLLAILYASLWVGVSYTSLVLSEKIISTRFPRNDGRLLPLVLLFGGVHMALSQMIEKSLLSLGILSAPSYFTHPAGAAYHWAGLAMIFLFCIMVGYRTFIRKYDWRFLLFFLPFAYVWTPHFSEGVILPLHMANAVWGLVILSFILFSSQLTLNNLECLDEERGPDYLPWFLVIIMIVSFTLIGLISGLGNMAGYLMVPPLFLLLASVEKFRFSYLICIYLIAVCLTLTSSLVLSVGMLVMILIKLLEMRSAES
ncbi:MAG: hypothetical protein GX817_06320 [Elusimicrobia bacterium]|nr:hypothetical protein [Elusimicrobiota bacterium]